MKPICSKYLLVLLLAGILYLPACYLDDTSVSSGLPLPYSTVAQLFDSTATNQQFLSIDAEQSNNLRTPAGARLQLEAYSFVNANGEAVSGQVEIGLREVYQGEKMLLNDLSSSPTDELWESAGIFQIEAQQNGVSLQLDKEAVLFLPTESFVQAQSGMRLAKGQAGNGSPRVSWQEAGTGSVALEMGQGYKVTFDQLGWFNGYYQSNASNSRFTLEVLPEDGFGTAVVDRRAFLLSSNSNVMVPLTSAGDKFTLNDLPAGFEGIVVVIGMTRNELLLGTREISIDQDLVVELDLAVTMEDDLIRQINELK